MVEATAGHPIADRVIEEMKAAGIRWIVTLPDSTTRVLQRIWRSDPFFRVVGAVHEEEAISIGCGLSIGGQLPLVVMENAGLFHCGDALRNLAIDMEIPIILGTSYLGRPKPNMPPDPPDVVNGDSPFSHIDQQGRLTEPWLRFWGIPSGIIDAPEGAKLIPWAAETARQRRGPAAILFDVAVGDFRL